ncbi:PucR family transcriptional regulator [Nocardia salmonicida]|uniref:PucR family transcriptional regulator n=1 Tax=Nocardia salmonicida TaxID=53431 RepID=UPI003798BA25
MTVVGTQSSDLSSVLAQRVLKRLDALTAELVDAIRAGDHAYAETTLLAQEQLTQVVRDNLASILEQLSGAGSNDFSAPATAGAVKAEHGVPLAALLHAYRLCGRLIWAHLLEEVGEGPKESLPQLASEVWRIIDEYSSAAAESYGRYVADRARRDGEHRRLMLRSLLSGEGEEAALWETARALRLPVTGTFVVVNAEVSADIARPLDGIEKLLQSKYVHSMWLTELDAQIGLLSFTAPGSRRWLPELLGEVAVGRIGISRPFADPTHAGTGSREAELARRCGDPGTNSVNSYGCAAIPLLLVQAPHPGREFAERILGPILELPEPNERRTLLDTLAMWFDCNGSSTQVASRLHYHRNTIHHRLRRIQELTGRSCADPAQASELFMAIRAVTLLSMDRDSR